MKKNYESVKFDIITYHDEVLAVSYRDSGEGDVLDFDQFEE